MHQQIISSYFPDSDRGDHYSLGSIRELGKTGNNALPSPLLRLQCGQHSTFKVVEYFLKESALHFVQSKDIRV